MKITHSQLLLFILILFSPLCKADDFQNFLWIPQGGIIPSNSPAINVYDEGYAAGTINIPNFSQWRNASSVCNGNNTHKDGKFTYWFQISDQWQHDPSGLKYLIVPKNNNGWTFVDSTYINTLPNFSTMTLQQSKYQELAYCWQIGEIKNFTPFFMPNPININIEIDRGSAIPGNYNIRIPYWLAYEENIGYGFSGADFSNYPAKIYQQQPDFYIDQSVEVHSKCSFDTSAINLSHGLITANKADGNKTNAHYLKIDCFTPTSLQLSIKGKSPVQGRTMNFTSCGDAGNCELNYNNNEYKGEVFIDRHKVIPITSTLHYDKGNHFSGKFTGSAVLSILVD